MSALSLSLSDGRCALALERCLADGGVAVFPSDTVYGLAADPLNRAAVERLYALKGRPLSKPAAVMFLNLERALTELPDPDPGPRTREAMTRLLPGGVTLLLPNPRGRFPLACGEDPGSLGVRVPAVDALAPVSRPLLQSSANLAGGADPRGLQEVPASIRGAADLVIDGGALPGTSSTVVDLRRYEEDGTWSVIRPGVVAEDELREALGGQFHFRPDSYLAEIRSDIPIYDRLQDELVAVSGVGARRILELGTGTGETARRLLEAHADALLTGIDESASMLAAAAEVLPPGRAELRVQRLQDPLPQGPFDLVASALCVHHLDGAEKADLFRRLRGVLGPGGRFILADVVVPRDAARAQITLTPGFDRPSAVADQLGWLTEAGFKPRLVWEAGDLAVVAALAA